MKQALVALTALAVVAGIPIGTPIGHCPDVHNPQCPKTIPIPSIPPVRI